jgi:hypothetical protein
VGSLKVSNKLELRNPQNLPMFALEVQHNAKSLSITPPKSYDNISSDVLDWSFTLNKIYPVEIILWRKYK